MFIKTEMLQQCVNINDPSAFKCFTDTLFRLISNGIKKGGYKSIVFICIGTDRSTGDSLGPLIGYKIGSLRYKNVFVHGNLDHPVHAKNLDGVMKNVSEKYNRPYIVAIDACLGRIDHIGCINIGEGAIKPGSGVNKNLMPVGHMFITGIVNFGGFMDFLILQNTRLNIVMKMADIISMGIKYVLWKINSDPEVSPMLYGMDA